MIALLLLLLPKYVSFPLDTRHHSGSFGAICIDIKDKGREWNISQLCSTRVNRKAVSSWHGYKHVQNIKTWGEASHPTTAGMKC